jgi:PAS domain S-box-containing protein
LGVPSASVVVWAPDLSYGTIRAAAGLVSTLVGERVNPGSISHLAAQRAEPVFDVNVSERPGYSDALRELWESHAGVLSVPLVLDSGPRITFQAAWLEEPPPAAVARAITAIRKLDAVTSIAFRLQRERENSAHHDLLSAVIEAVPDGIWIRHDDAVTVNAAMREILRLPDGEPVSPDQHVAPRHLDGTPVLPEEWPANVCQRTGEVAKARFLSTIRGEEYVLEYKAAPMPDGYVGVVRDVTEEHGEQMMTQHFLESLFESLPLGAAVADLATGEIQSVNRAWVDLLGFERGEAIGALQPYPWWDPDFQAEHWQDPQGPVQTVFRRKDGRPVPVELLPFHVTGVDGAGARIVVLVSNTAERREFERQIVQSGKLAAIGELASGVAHEINNPLFAILGLVEFLLKDAEAGTKAHERLSLIQQTGLEIKEIVKALLDFARERTDEHRPLLLREVVAETVELVRRTSSAKGIEIVESYCGEPVQVVGSPNQIKQIVLNLISNAQQAMGDTGTVSLTVEPHEDSVTVAVSDTGPGIPQELLSRVFEPFFTTKRDLGGTGLGLAVSHGIAEMHGGRLTAESPPGEGATFCLCLPLMDEGDD